MSFTSKIVIKWTRPSGVDSFDSDGFPTWGSLLGWLSRIPRSRSEKQEVQWICGIYKSPRPIGYFKTKKAAIAALSKYVDDTCLE